jgi:hypothetical protein
MITETVKNYRIILNSIDNIIEASGYKISWIEEQMGMNRVSFYAKRKSGNFTIDEMEKLVKILKADELEDKILLEMSIENEKDVSVEL